MAVLAVRWPGKRSCSTPCTAVPGNVALGQAKAAQCGRGREDVLPRHWLQAGDRVLEAPSLFLLSLPQVALVFPNNDPAAFMVAFYGCLLAEVVPVPIEVPLTRKVNEMLSCCFRWEVSGCVSGIVPQAVTLRAGRAFGVNGKPAGALLCYPFPHPLENQVCSLREGYWHCPDFAFSSWLQPVFQTGRIRPLWPRAQQPLSELGCQRVKHEDWRRW